MKINTVFLFLLLISSTTIYAQKGTFSASAGPTYGLPLSNIFKRYFHNGVGGDLRLLYNTTNHSAAFVNLSRLYIGSKQVDGGSLQLNAAKFGYTTYFNKTHIFILAHTGLYSLSAKTFDSRYRIGFGGGMGYTIPIGKQSNIDIQSTFDNFISPAQGKWLNFHAGYRINLNKK